MFRLALLTALSLSAFGADFAKSLYPALEAAGCRGCHSADGVASATRLHFPESDASAAQIEDFGKSLVVLVDRAKPEESLLFRKPTNRIPHSGGERIRRGTPQEAALKAWVEQLASMSPEEVAAATKVHDAPAAKAPAVAIRRLTHSQYNNTVRDLLGDRSLPASQFPPEDFVNGFKNQYQAQSISPILMDAYSNAAEKLAKAAFRNGIPPALIPCKPSASCRTQFIRGFGLRAFRRPLDPREMARYDALFVKQANFGAGAQIVIEAMLQSPNFLFRMDETTEPRWKPYAAASRLSYALWDTMPDAALLDAAAHGDLNTREGIGKAARRMLADPKAKQALDEFTTEWLRFDRALTAAKDRTRFREFTPETLYAMTQEARFFISDLVWNDRNFMDLYTADYGFMNGDLAKLYGVNPPATDYERVAFPAGSERAGLLGQALFLAETAKPDETSPTARGLFVREQLLCQHVPDPPPGVNTNLPEVTEDKPKTNRERMAEHTTNETCARCHSLIDPIGFGFEKFDATGARREKLELVFRKGEGEKRKVAKKIQIDLDTTGQVAGIRDSGFSSPQELGAILAKSDICQECVVKQYFRYVAGRTETIADRRLLARVFDDFRNSGFRFKELIISMVLNREFPEGQELHAANHH
ncbi:MAG TPA: DUF1592 domain-containing protein [Bryobacteraceae bacterium]|nr:DUF1592 domain-containing protein [Bryobacteraceae bacterium]